MLPALHDPVSRKPKGTCVGFPPSDVNRLPVAEFHPSKDHRQATNRWNRFVLGEEYIKEAAKRYPKSKEYAQPLLPLHELT
jgi:hypothetical protein